MHPTEEKIYSFLDLPVGWNYGREGPVHVDVVEKALRWNKFLLGIGFPETDAFPGCTISVMLTAYLKDDNGDYHTIEVTLTDDDKDTTWNYECNTVELEWADHISANEVEKQIVSLISRLLPYRTGLVKAVKGS